MNKPMQTAALFAATAGALLAVASQSQAQSWPVKPVRVIVPFAAGGNTDSIARLAAEVLTGALGQQVLVDNKPGGNGVIAGETVAPANADGDTLLMMPMAMAAVLPAMPSATRLP